MGSGMGSSGGGSSNGSLGSSSSDDGNEALAAELEQWINICMHVFTGLFSYLNLCTMPWRLSIAIHHWSSHRSSACGLDFYGRKTDALWFFTPPCARSVICTLLLLALGFHYATQVRRRRLTPTLCSAPADSVL